MLIPSDSYRKTRGIIRLDTRANQPLATAVLEGTLYFVSDESVIERSNGTTWDDVTPAGGGGGVTDHAALTGLGDDDHPHYHTDARGDARYSVLGHTHAGMGDVVGPAVAVDNAVARFDGTTGKLIQDSGVVISDAGYVGIGIAAPTQPVHVLLPADTNAQIVIQTTDAVGLNAIGSLYSVATGTDVGVSAHGAGRTISRWGITLASWAEIHTSVGNGLIIGTRQSAPIVFGTNLLERMRIDANGDVTMVSQLAVNGASISANRIFTLGGSFTGSTGTQAFSITAALTGAINTEVFAGVYDASYVTHTSGTHAIFGGIDLRGGTVTNLGAGLTNTAQIWIRGPLVATVSGKNYAIWVDDGDCRFDSKVEVGSTFTAPANIVHQFGTASASAVSCGLNVIAGSGASSGPYIRFSRNTTDVGFLGSWAAILGGGSVSNALLMSGDSVDGLDIRANHAAGVIKFSVASQERMRIEASGRISIPGYTNESSLTVGGFEMQSYSLNNNWICDNLYFNGGFRYRVNGSASQIYFDLASIGIYTSPAGLAGAVATRNIRLNIDPNGNIGLNTAFVGTGGVNVLSMFNGTAPSTSATNIGQIYMESGALKYRSPAGTITTLGPA